MTRIDRYIASSVLRASAVVIAVVLALSAVSTFLGEADNFAEGQHTVVGLLAYVALKMPDHLHGVMPAVALLGALVGLGALAAGSELVVMRASGVSIARLGWSVARAGVILALITVALGEWLGPNALRLAERMDETGREQAGAQSIGGGLWLREGDRTIWVAGILAEDTLAGITVYRRGADGAMQSIVAAERARYEDGGWRLMDIRKTRFGDQRIMVGRAEERPWDVSLRPDFLRFAVVKPEELSSLGLYRYGRYLSDNEVNAESYRLALWRNLTAPFTVLLLTVIALPFAFGALRSAGAGQRLFVGGLAGLVFFMCNEIAVSLGQVYGLPAWLASGWPTAAVGIATLVWFRRLR